MQILAPAKLNLFLHITGRRSDQYHLLESVMAFTTFGDTLTMRPYHEFKLILSGPFKDALSTHVSENLIIRAANMLKEKYRIAGGAHIQLIKNIPVGAGLGGGSSDAAATLIGLNRLWKLNLTTIALSEIALRLGADVPACLYRQPLMATGIGEIISPVSIPCRASPVLLIYPNQSLSTPSVFQQFRNSALPFSPGSKTNFFPQDWPTWVDFLQKRKNDLEAPAIALLPIIATLVNALQSQTRCQLARMTGSGSACFALFDDKIAAQSALITMQKLFPGFWITLTRIPWVYSR